MPVLNKFKIRSPFEEFENYLGEEMNTFSGFFSDVFIEEEENLDNSPIAYTENIGIEEVRESFWKRMFQQIFKFSSELFS